MAGNLKNPLEGKTRPNRSTRRRPTLHCPATGRDVSVLEAFVVAIVSNEAPTLPIPRGSS